MNEEDDEYDLGHLHVMRFVDPDGFELLCEWSENKWDYGYHRIDTMPFNPLYVMTFVMPCSIKGM